MTAPPAAIDLWPEQSSALCNCASSCGSCGWRVASSRPKWRASVDRAKLLTCASTCLWTHTCTHILVMPCQLPIGFQSKWMRLDRINIGQLRGERSHTATELVKINWLHFQSYTSFLESDEEKQRKVGKVPTSSNKQWSCFAEVNSSSNKWGKTKNN